MHTLCSIDSLGLKITMLRPSAWRRWRVCADYKTKGTFAFVFMFLSFRILQQFGGDSAAPLVALPKPLQRVKCVGPYLIFWDVPFAKQAFQPSLHLHWEGDRKRRTYECGSCSGTTYLAVNTPALSYRQMLLLHFCVKFPNSAIELGMGIGEMVA